MLASADSRDGVTSKPSTSATATKVTLRSTGLGRSQRIHAWVLFGLPLLGVIIAGIRAAYAGLTAFELGLFAVTFFLTFSGITVGFHRLLSHRAFEAGPRIRAILTILGSMAAQGPPIYWVSNHRRHHQFSDQSGDPHSPHYDGDRALTLWSGIWHAQVAWTYRHTISNPLALAKDLLRDPLLVTINRQYYLWVAAGLILPAILGAVYTQTLTGAFSGFLWGGLVRIFVSYHAANSINSVTHLFGSRPFKTRENSRNNAWLAIPTCGESWHNNHHAFPNSAIFGLAWWQLDLGGLVVRMLAMMGLAHRVRRPTPQAMLKHSKRLIKRRNEDQTPKHKPVSSETTEDICE